MNTIPYLAEYKSKWYQENKEQIHEKYVEDKEKKKARAKKYHEEHREEILAKQKIYRDNNKEKCAIAKAKCYYQSKEEYSQSRKEYYQKNKERILSQVKKYRDNNIDAIKDRNRVKNYGLVLGDFDKMIISQDNKCCICNKELGVGKEIAIDHCHTSGNVRGILCSGCNLMLGMAYDDIEIFKSAILYLEKHSNKESL